jgi:uncharacterized protein involved in exopolysaccharide biosynthesis
LGPAVTGERRPLYRLRKSDVVAVLFRQRRLVVISFAVIFLGGMLYQWLAPSDEAELKVLVRRARVDPVMSPTSTQTLLLDHDAITEEAVNPEVVLLLDEDALETVVKPSGLISGEESWFRKLTGESGNERLAREVRTLGRKLEIGPVRACSNC